MERSKFIKQFFILFSLLFITSCQHDWVLERKAHLKEIQFGPNLNNSFKEKVEQNFIHNSTKGNINLNLISLQFKKKNIYGGVAARAKQIEIIGELEYKFQSMISSSFGTLKISGWIPVNEDNPQAEIMAQRELISDLETLLLVDLMQEYWLIEN